MAEYTALAPLFTDIANAIRSKTGETGAITANSFPEKINQIPKLPFRYGQGKTEMKQTYDSSSSFQFVTSYLTTTSLYGQIWLIGRMNLCVFFEKLENLQNTSFYKYSSNEDIKVDILITNYREYWQLQCTPWIGIQGQYWNRSSWNYFGAVYEIK